MSKYLKKVLITYISITMLLCGMAFATYAVTASEAYGYITRSEYSIDMSYLQLKIDEAESGLLGKINKYRATDVKFVTWDTPNNYSKAANYTGGYHNGGNYFLNRPYSSSGADWRRGAFGPFSSVIQAQNGNTTTINLYRIYNGNFLITSGIAYYSYSGDTAQYQFATGVNYCVPCENLPGWYLIVSIPFQYYNRLETKVALIKLDPDVPYPDAAGQNAIKDKELQFRFKKELFTYIHSSSSKINPTKTTATVSQRYYLNNYHCNGFQFLHRSDVSETGYMNLTTTSILDPSTNDFIITLKGMYPCAPNTGSYCYYTSDASFRFNSIIPVDNVEYVISWPAYYNYFDTGSTSAYPDSRYIGTGQQTDGYREYEFVDCVNGIRYWHSKCRARKAVPAGATAGAPFAYTTHFCLPIVY